MFVYIYRSRRIPYVKSELLSKPPEHLRLPGISGKPEPGLELPAAVGEDGVIALEGTAIPMTHRLPKAVLTKDQELKLLREKFLMGDITEETYRELKTEIETSKDITELEEVEPESDEVVAEEEPPSDEDLEREMEMAMVMAEEPIPTEPGLVEEEVRAAKEAEELDKELGGEVVEEKPGLEEENVGEPLMTKKRPKLKKKKKGKKNKLKEKIDLGPVEESVAEDEMHDIPEQVHPFPEDSLCITCGQSLDPDVAFCWSCGTKYEHKDVGK